MKRFAVMMVMILCFFALTCPANAAELPDSFPPFSSVNLGGDPVTNEIFAAKELTMVNIWTTWCPPCIAEMPDLGNMGRTMPEGSQLVGIVLDAIGRDAPSASDEAKRILSRSKADFLQVMPSEQMIPVLEWVQAIPTTIFVDSKGRIVGEPLVGARPEAAYRAEVENLLKSAR